MSFQRHIFVFGSNPEGRHGRGAAEFAHDYFGAKYGEAQGLTGDAYGIITKELHKGQPAITLDFVARQLQELHTFIRTKPDWLFLLSPVGTNLAGFSKSDIYPLLAPLCKETNVLFVDKTVPMEIPQRDLGEYHG